MNEILELVAACAPTGSDAVPNRWLDTLDSLFTDAPPAFTRRWYGELYRNRALDLTWLARSMAANSRKEAAGSRTLNRMARTMSGTDVGELLAAHARDEARHASLYLRMQRALFDEDGGDALQVPYAGSPYRAVFRSAVADADLGVIDELVQINLGELRTFVNQLLMRPVVEIVADGLEQNSAVMTTIDELLADELAHIVYSGRLLEAALARPETVPLVSRRLRDFEQYTLDELGVNTTGR
jgi:hypothetical protein